MKVEFWSGVEGASCLCGLLQGIREAGHAASQRFQISSHAYRGACGRVDRSWLRFRMYVVYPIQLLWDRVSRWQPRVAVVTTNTFFAPLLAAAFRSRRRPVVNLVYDLFPEALIVAGTIPAGSRLDKVVRHVTAWTCRRCAANVFLGDQQKALAEELYGAIPNAVVIPVGGDDRPFTESCPYAGVSASNLTLLYAGNFGRMHDFETLAQALKDTSTARWQGMSLQIHAHGPGVHGFSRTLGLGPAVADAVLVNGFSVAVAGNLPEREWIEAMKSSQVGIVTMIDGAERLGVPSKAYSAMMAGQALLAICAPECDLAELVSAHDCGWVAPPGDVNGLKAVLDEIGSRPDEVLRKRRNAWLAGHERYSASALTRQWLELLRGLDCN